MNLLLLAQSTVKNLTVWIISPVYKKEEGRLQDFASSIIPNHECAILLGGPPFALALYNKLCILVPIRHFLLY